MIVDFKRGNVLVESELPLAFCVNSEGYNDSGFAGQVAERYWPELARIGPTRLGALLSRRLPERLLFAMCVHSLDADPGWSQAPKLIYDALWSAATLPMRSDPDSLKFDPGPRVAVPLPGAGPVGQAQGADVIANLGALARLEIAVEVWTL